MIEKRFEELNERAYERGYNTFSDFLNIEEQSVLKSTYLPCVLFGGYPMAERVVAGFGDDLNGEKFRHCFFNLEHILFWQQVRASPLCRRTCSFLLYAFLILPAQNIKLFIQ